MSLQQHGELARRDRYWRGLQWACVVNAGLAIVVVATLDPLPPLVSVGLFIYGAGVGALSMLASEARKGLRDVR